MLKNILVMGLISTSLVFNNLQVPSSTDKVVIESKINTEKNYQGELSLIDNYVPGDYKAILLRHNKKIRYGFINMKSGKIIDPQYEGIIHFHSQMFVEGLEPVMKDSKWGYINPNNKTIIDFKYDNAYGFMNGHAVVKTNNKWGLINKANKTIIPFLYDDIFSYDQGLYMVNSNMKYGFFNMKTKKLIKPIFIDQPVIAGKIIYGRTSENKHVVMDLNGKILKTSKSWINLEGQRDEKIYSHIKEPIFIFYSEKEKMGADIYQDGQIKTFLKPIYDNLYFQEDRINYSLRNKHDFEDGFFNLKGEKMKHDTHGLVTYGKLINGLKIHYTNQGIGYADKDNKPAFKAKFTSAEPFFKNGYAFAHKDRNMLLIDKKGRTLLSINEGYFTPLLDMSLEDMYKTDFRYLMVRKDKNSDLYDLKTKSYLARGYTCYDLVDGKILACKEDTMTLLDSKGKVIVGPRKNFSYDEYKAGYFIEDTKAGMYLTDLKGKKLHDNIYNHISNINDYGYRRVEVNGEYSIADKDGNLILDDFYDHILFINKDKVLAINSSMTKSSIVTLTLNN